VRRSRLDTLLKREVAMVIVVARVTMPAAAYVEEDEEEKRDAKA
jgi:hypothetical protein